MTAAGPHLFWITSRAAGTAALILSSTSLGVGLLIRGRRESRRLPAVDTRALHEALSLATLAAIAVHGLALVGDAYMHPSLLDISVPFTGAYRPLWTGIGIVAGWGLAALGLSYYARDRIGQARWRYLHRFTALFWALGVVHTLGAGTDAGQLWLLVALIAPAGPALVLLMGKWMESTAAAAPLQSPAEARSMRRNSA